MVVSTGINRVRTAVFISGTGSNLKSLVKFSKTKLAPISINFIVSNNPKAKGLNYAKKFKIKKKILNFKNKKLSENKLLSILKKNNIEEIILATSATVEGQTTAFYIQDSLRNINVKISKLAQGLPVGGEIENLDDGTLVSAFKNRKII